MRWRGVRIRRDRRAARHTYRDAFIAAFYAGRLAHTTRVAEVAAAVRSAPPSTDPPSATDELLDAAAVLINDDWAAGAARWRRALADFLALPRSAEEELRWLPFACLMAIYSWDDGAWDAISVRIGERVRDAGVLALLPMADSFRVAWELFAGDLAAAAALVHEQDTVQEAIGGDPSPGSPIALAAFCGREADVKELDEANTQDGARGTPVGAPPPLVDRRSLQPGGARRRPVGAPPPLVDRRSLQRPRALRGGPRGGPAGSRGSGRLSRVRLGSQRTCRGSRALRSTRDCRRCAPTARGDCAHMWHRLGPRCRST